MTDPKPNADALAKQLQESLAKRRPRTWKPVLAVLILSTLFLALLAWWLYPRPPLPLLQIIALDTIVGPNETPLARAQLFAPAQAERPRNLSGQTVVFKHASKPGENPREIVMKSDDKGQAAAEVALEPKQTRAEFLVRHFDLTRYLQGSPPELGRIFVWPKDAPLLIVDADETLIAKDLDAKAAATLKKADEEGWRIVYLSLAGTHAEEFRKARLWLEMQPTLPKGPMLGRATYPSDETIEQARRDVLRSLHSRFTGSTAAVVASAEAAQICKEIGLRTFLIGAAEAPAEVMHVASWGDIPVKR